MRNAWWIVTMVVLWVAEAGIAEEKEAPTAGKEMSVVLPMSGGTMKVYIPSNYTAGRTWPTVFFYHGMNGSPTTDLVRQFSEGRDFVVVGMPYMEEGGKTRTAEEHRAYMKREQENFRRAKEWLLANVKADPGKIFISGVSLGGWMTSNLGDLESGKLAGLAILLAGRSQRGGTPPPGLSVRGKPIYIGAGESDANMPAARMAAEFYRRQGATVTFEEYPGMGHQVPAEAPRLKAWLQMQGGLRGKPADDPAVEDMKNAFQKKFEETKGMTEVAAKYAAIREIVDDPRLPLCGPTVVAGMGSQLAAAAGQSPAKEEWLAEAGFREAIWDEMTIRTLSDMKKAKDAYQKVSETYPETRFGKLAKTQLEAVAKAYDKSAEATRRANPSPSAVTPPAAAKPVAPSFPTSGRTDPRGALVPVREGNKIIYRRVVD